MARSKAIKRKTKRQSMNNMLVEVQKIENNFMRTPDKLVTQLGKEINAHKKMENKLKTAISKNKNLTKNAETRVESILNAKNTPTSKKKLNKAKKIVGQLNKSSNELDSKLNSIAKILKALLDKQSRLISLNKYLNQFEKEWVKLSKQAKSDTKVKKNKIKSKSSPAIEQPSIQAEIPLDTSFNEITELAS